MKTRDNIKRLLADAAAVADCVDARVAWVNETSARWREAQKQMDQRLGAAVDRVSEQEFDRMFDEEQAKVDAFREPMMRAHRDDAWPRHLHAKGI